jgi:HK97 family phage portal protein
MGVLDWLLGREPEQFSQLPNLGTATAYAAWLAGETSEQETVTPYTVMGLAAVIRAVSVISTTLAGLPLRTYERSDNGERTRIRSVFDDPYPGIDGMTPFAWVETVFMHLLLWRKAFLWHEERDTRTGFVTAYRPMIPSAIEKVERVNGKLRFTYEDGETHEKVTVGTEAITYIPGPSLDGVTGHPILEAARSIFSGAISGDKAAQRTLRMGIRLAGLATPAKGEDDFEPAEADAILEKLRATVVGREHSGDIAIVNRKLDLQRWTPTNIEAQWDFARSFLLDEIAGRIFGLPNFLYGNIDKQTSWGTGVAEQNLSFARYTLMGWSTRVEQALSRRLPTSQFVEFDYRGLLQGTPAQEIELLLKETGNEPFLLVEEARRIQNLPPLTPAQKAELALQRKTPGGVTDPPPVENPR